MSNSLKSKHALISLSNQIASYPRLINPIVNNLIGEEYRLFLYYMCHHATKHSLNFEPKDKIIETESMENELPILHGNNSEESK